MKTERPMKNTLLILVKIVVINVLFCVQLAVSGS